MKQPTIEITPGEMHSKVESWSLPTDNEIQQYTSNQVIHAYTTGFSEGMDQDDKLFKKQIDDNAALAGNDTHKVVNYLQSVGISPLSAHLRIESRYTVDILITVSDEDFVKDSFSDVYSFANELQEKSKTDFYFITFSFINRSRTFNQNMVRSDGFISSFRPLEKE